MGGINENKKHHLDGEINPMTGKRFLMLDSGSAVVDEIHFEEHALRKLKYYESCKSKICARPFRDRLKRFYEERDKRDSEEDKG